MKDNGKSLHPVIQTSKREVYPNLMHAYLGPPEYALLVKLGNLLRESSPPSTNPKSPLPSISNRLPPHSPAISYGILEEASKGGGMMAAMQQQMASMMGGGAPADQPPAPVHAGPSGRPRRGKVR